MKPCLARFVVSFVISLGALHAQALREYWPGATYDPAIPTFEQVLGYKPGEQISSHAQIMRYFHSLAEAAPERMKIVEYAKSWEGRELIYGVIGSPENVARLEEVKSGMQRLADPRKTNAEAVETLVSDLPATVWLAYGVHGNEISSCDAAMLTAYHLLAAQNDPIAEKVRGNVLLLLNPTQNPDGRDRFVNHYRMSAGLEPSDSPYNIEHDEPWPRGRTNHYLFDLNRDWFALTQPETRGHVKALLEWYPLVFVDLHEMGSNTTYYFTPEAAPFNPHFTKTQRESLNWFGKNNAKWFDKFGFDYFTREVFDAFYPGYGASWPIYYGGIAATYEQASSRGLVIRRSDGKTMRYRETVRHHFTASLATAETAADNRAKLLQNFYDYRRSAIDEGRNEDVKAFLLPRKGNTANVDKLAAILHEQGIEVHQSHGAGKTCEVEAPMGSFLVPLAQPSKRLIRTLLDRQVSMEPEFIQEAERRRKKDLPDEIYDVAAWSLPLQFGVEVAECKQVPNGFAPIEPERIPAGEVIGEAAVAYLVPWGTSAAGRFLTAGLLSGLKVLSSDKAFEMNGSTYPRGTLALKVLDNPGSLRETLVRLARETGADVEATDTAWVERGVNLGSRYVFPMKKARVALAWDIPTTGYGAGNTRFVMERQFGYPVHPIRTRTLAGADLSAFDVLILPHGRRYAEVLKEEALNKMKQWVERGGTLIAVRGAVSALAASKVELLDLKLENAGGEEPKKDPEEKPRDEKKADGAKEEKPKGKLLAKEEDFLKAIQPESEAPDDTPGVLVKARVDPDHWITAGLEDSIIALVEGRDIYSPIKLDKGVNAVYWAGPDEMLQSGYLWEENRKQLAFKPAIVVQPVGRGFVIAFTTDPNYRAYMDGLNVTFLNAVFRGAAHASPAAGR
jgi:hypothetical protein